MNHPKLYVKSGCPWCAEAMTYLDQNRIAYQKIVVSDNAGAFDDLLRLSGQDKTPTLDWHGRILADFGVDELIPFLRSVRS